MSEGAIPPVRFKLRTERGHGLIVFQMDDLESGDGRVVTLDIPDPKVMREWQRQSKGNPELHCLRGGAIFPQDADTNVYCICQMLSSIAEKARGFSYIPPEIPKGKPDEPGTWH
jgi:hypothetical protein